MRKQVICGWNSFLHKEKIRTVKVIGEGEQKKVGSLSHLRNVLESH